MRGTPYVRRKIELNGGIYRESDKIIIGERTWDGIGRPDYESKMTLNSDEARFVAQELLKLAEKIDGKGKRDRTYAKIRSNTLKIALQAKREAMG